MVGIVPDLLGEDLSSPLLTDYIVYRAKLVEEQMPGGRLPSVDACFRNIQAIRLLLGLDMDAQAALHDASFLNHLLHPRYTSRSLGSSISMDYERYIQHSIVACRRILTLQGRLSTAESG